MDQETPLGTEAARLLALVQETGPAGLIHVTDDEARALGVARFMRSVAPELQVLVLPAWDCLPYDRASPSRDVMGQRLHVLGELASDRRIVLLTTYQAALQRLPPPTSLTSMEVRAGDELDRAALQAFCGSAGYRIDERVDEVGELAFRGEVVDIFPGACALPYRLQFDERRLETIKLFDPASQRSVGEADGFVIGRVSEAPGEDGEDSEPEAGAEHRLFEHYPSLATLFDYMPEAVLVETAGGEQAMQAVLAQIAEAYAHAQRGEQPEGPIARAPAPERLYLGADDWNSAAASRNRVLLETGTHESVPIFAREARPARAFRAFVDEQLRRGRRVLLTAPTTRALAELQRRGRLSPDKPLDRPDDWKGVRGAPAGSLMALEADLDQGFVEGVDDLAVVAAGDLLGSLARRMASPASPEALSGVDLAEFHLEDFVVHADHGLARLIGLETVAGEDAAAEAIRLEYAAGQGLLVPAPEAGKLWRYGSDESEIALDRLNSETWRKRRDDIAAAVSETAQALMAATAERAKRQAPKLIAPSAAYERFVAGFPYSATPDQDRAIGAVMSDLRAGVPMNRLVVGDVGFGKTEVALRAAAVAVLAGVQVAVVAPTTVLARQHFDTFGRRFAELGVEVAQLSRLVGAKEARRVREGLESGDAPLVVGTHALLGEKVRFARLGLLVIDEEQRFGAQHKQKLRALGEDVHLLTMSATPIPQTLQSALIGLQDLSAITTPPLRRRPIRTLIAERDPAVLRQVLLREKRRGGQSFVVVPRVEDIEAAAETLRGFVPRFDVRIAHGQMPAREIDDAMVGFAEGQGDVLLATSIIESGLDVPRANTMAVLRADLFGLAQLHQLRGRVGRSQMQAFCYFMSEPGQELSEAAMRRLGTLQALDRIGAGMAISRHDLEVRGGGELFGERQSGHIKRIGSGLYQDLLAQALRAAKGEPVRSEDVVLQAPLRGVIPEDYVSEPIVRINIYHRLARTRGQLDVDLLAEEIADRFGPPPEAVGQLLAGARARALSRDLGVVHVSAGPDGVALTFAEGLAVETEFADVIDRLDGLEWTGERLLYRHDRQSPEPQYEAMLRLLDELA